MGPIAGPRPEEDSAGPRSESLDALRGLAISAVIARHYFEFKYGMLGVDLFFVVSGFLIGGILLDSREQPGYFSSFYGRRAFRILPLYWLLLLIATPDHWGYYLFFLQAVPWLQFSYPMTEPTFVSWTLAIEEQFYLILPLLIWSLPREWLVRVLWCGVLIAPVCRWLFHAHLPDLSWEFLLPCRLDELFGGVLLACFVRGHCRSPPVWAALACAPMLCDLTYAAAFGPFSFLGISAFACGVIVWAGINVQKTVLLKPFIWPGRRCYALYLFHLIVLNIFLSLDFGAWSGLIALPIVCVLAEISWRAIESPLIDYAKRRFARVRPVARPACCRCDTRKPANAEASRA
ncbi:MULTISPECIES: acyltransferase family protein [Bradyrhizobium]|uniref:Peptidoglycan/LPS O-acetylase OafA/YrhL n=1 Tax=Bradyrhizobium elkanii TaxID=29448 RepID=A0A8I1Y763_BRAEL|nr:MULTISPECIES: acyltransferase [Bradyrhizobium]MBP1293997.1 peptidoglycan/LPS O-acetylase OafA/YrhL [Bradyrhizobium elkanii]MCP1925419.1 peptidoglycan/LPS O-acetylase OafA/YrhL [Bradyrhizobium elkanii]MCS3477087.1 peptidoglycan/LPS O-acetylase OafA/YrhL [Bradyrhizobium elkanii]MCS3583825.1 peptidoglycan/LPS O-acetylase OafA/YrhL [Bradyrhizobium elkanii]MCS3717395.1 peptidoglycan/LPS O-acetylase OafA/YrhL [Bradyrhizobium elkanii]